MTLRHMKIFCALCDHDCNTTRTAAALNMTQPAVSLCVRELEEYYGVCLFDRIGRRLQITEAGQRLARYARHISALFDDMETGLRNWDTLGVVRVGASITIGSQFLPDYVRVFNHRYPDMEVRAVVEPSAKLEEKIMRNELDIALIEGVVHQKDIVCQPYMEDRLSVVCPADGPWRQGQKITPEEFRRQKFLLREPGSGTREVFDRVTEHAGFSVTPLWEAMSTTALVNAVACGLGIAVLPRRMIIGAVRRGLVTTVEVEGLDFCRAFHIIHHKDKYLTPSLQAFLEICLHYEEDYPLPEYTGLY